MSNKYDMGVLSRESRCPFFHAAVLVLPAAVAGTRIIPADALTTVAYRIDFLG